MSNTCPTCGAPARELPGSMSSLPRYKPIPDPRMVALWRWAAFVAMWLKFLRAHRVAGTPDIVAEAIVGCLLRLDEMDAAVEALRDEMEARDE